MTRLRWVLAALAWVAVAQAKPAPAGDPGVVKIAVLDIRATGTDESTARTLTEILAVEVGRFAGTQVVTSNEVESMLGLEQRKQIVGCNENVSCVAEIAGALGVDMLCTGSLGIVDGTSVLTLRVIDVRKARVEARLYETDSRAGAFIAKMPGLAAKLFPKLREAPAPEASARRETPARDGESADRDRDEKNDEKAENEAEKDRDKEREKESPADESASEPRPTGDAVLEGTAELGGVGPFRGLRLKNKTGFRWTQCDIRLPDGRRYLLKKLDPDESERTALGRFKNPDRDGRRDDARSDDRGAETKSVRVICAEG